MNQLETLEELEPVAATLLDRHLGSAKDWHPHQYVPWERATQVDFDEEWQDDGRLTPAAQSALFVNLLTEDNLPYYHATIESALGGRQEAWKEWNRRWTAEEARHAMVIRDYLTVDHAVDPMVLERARMHQMSTGVTPALDTPADLFAYASMQELATRISHRNTGKHLNDPVGMKLMSRVSMDENLHFLFYRDAMAAFLEMNPSEGVLAIERQVRGFEMPGTGIEGFKKHARLIASAGIYDMEIHYEQILKPVVLGSFAVETLTGLSPEAEQAQEKLLKLIERIGKAAARAARQRAEQAEVENESKATGTS